MVSWRHLQSEEKLNPQLANKIWKMKTVFSLLYPQRFLHGKISTSIGNVRPFPARLFRLVLGCIVQLMFCVYSLPTPVDIQHKLFQCWARGPYSPVPRVSSEKSTPNDLPISNHSRRTFMAQNVPAFCVFFVDKLWPRAFFRGLVTNTHTPSYLRWIMRIFPAKW